MAHGPILVLANPSSTNPSADDGRLAEAVATLAATDRAVHPPLDDPRDIPRLIRAHRGEVETVVLAGGDGTVNRALPALLETGIALGLLPLGTANDLARTLELPLDPVAAAEVVLRGARRAIDIGRVNDVPFVNVATIGLGVHVTHGLTPERKARWGVLGYPITVLDALRALRPFTVHLTCDGRRSKRRVLQISVGNGRSYGGGMVIHHDAAIDDARLDVLALEPQSALSLVNAFPALRTGQVDELTNTFTDSAVSVEIRTSKPMDVSADGELVARTPARFAVTPRALTVLAPS